jgi:hypothetical protein
MQDLLKRSLLSSQVFRSQVFGCLKLRLVWKRKKCGGFKPEFAFAAIVCKCLLASSSLNGHSRTNWEGI